MPPPKRNPRPKDSVRRGQTVYPPQRVRVPLGGWATSQLTPAVECWAKLLEPATLHVAGALSPAEWNFLAQASVGREKDFDPDLNNPGDRLAQIVEGAATYESGLALLAPQKARAKDKVADLAARLRGLDYLHSWAVIWAIRWRAGLEAAPGPDEEWWTLAHRQAYFAAEAKAEGEHA